MCFSFSHKENRFSTNSLGALLNQKNCINKNTHGKRPLAILCVSTNLFAYKLHLLERFVGSLVIRALWRSCSSKKWLLLEWLTKGLKLERFWLCNWLPSWFWKVFFILTGGLLWSSLVPPVTRPPFDFSSEPEPTSTPAPIRDQCYKTF